MSSFAKWLIGELARRKWRQTDLAQRAGLTNATVSRVLNGSRRAGPEVCLSLADALDLPPEHVFRMAGLLPAGAVEIEEEQEALGLFRKLDAQMRPLALGILRMLDSARRSAPSLSEQLARDLAREMETMAPEDQQRVFELMKRLRDEPVAGSLPAEPEPT